MRFCYHNKLYNKVMDTGFWGLNPTVFPGRVHPKIAGFYDKNKNKTKRLKSETVKFKKYQT